MVESALNADMMIVKRIKDGRLNGGRMGESNGCQERICEARVRVLYYPHGGVYVSGSSLYPSLRCPVQDRMDGRLQKKQYLMLRLTQIGLRPVLAQLMQIGRSPQLD
jgi:hypothetical protein